MLIDSKFPLPATQFSSIKCQDDGKGSYTYTYGHFGPEEIERREKNKSIKELVQPNDDTFGRFEDSLMNLPLEQIMALQIALKDFFAPNCTNEFRYKIVLALLDTSIIQWDSILKQTRFILPHCDDANFLAETIAKLTSMPNCDYRMQLVNTANRFFKCDTSVENRYKTLKTLSKYDLDQLKNTDAYSETERVKFMNVNGLSY